MQSAGRKTYYVYFNYYMNFKHALNGGCGYNMELARWDTAEELNAVYQASASEGAEKFLSVYF